MPRLNNNEADITLVKQTGTVLTVCADQTYVDGDPVFNLSVQGGTTAAGSASADVDVSSTQGTAGGTNISGVIGTKASSEPSSGYYIRMDATGSGNSQVSTAGWIDAGSMATASASVTKYFPIDAGSVTQNAPTINTSTGVVTATATVEEGYVEDGTETATLNLATHPGATVTPTRSIQTVSTGSKWCTGDVSVAAIPSDYYLLGEIFPIGSFYANTTGTDPAVTLQFGTWTLVRSIPYRWMDVAINEWDSYEENDDWSFSNHVSEDVYVFQRTA